MIDNSNPHRLSELVVPENYKIILEPNLNEHTFNGEVNINIDVINNIDQIIINSAELLIKSVEIFSENNNKIGIKNFSNDETLERLTIFLKEEIQNGRYQLNIVFSGDRKSVV